MRTVHNTTTMCRKRDVTTTVELETQLLAASASARQINSQLGCDVTKPQHSL
jgi:Trp operon repressor